MHRNKGLLLQREFPRRMVAVLLLLVGVLLSVSPVALGQDAAALEAIRKGRNKPTPKPTPKPVARPKPRPRPIPRKPTPKPTPRVLAVKPRPTPKLAPVRALPALPPGIRSRINPTDGAQMVWIPAGEFIRGSEDRDRDAGQDEKSRRKIFLDGYWIYRFPVTVGQYRKFCQATGQQMPAAPPWGWKEDHPMVQVTWEEAHEYAEWADSELPTEAQFEKAARGTDGRKYPWGNAWSAARCIFQGNSGKRTASVYRADRVHQSPFGARDMVGHVWQWCRDWWEEGYYDYAPPKNPSGPDNGKTRALRGGSWNEAGPPKERELFRTADRGFAEPDKRATFRGFRCVVSKP